MTDSSREFNRALNQIQALIFVQRGIRIIFRAFWLGIAGYIFGWGIHHFFGFLQDQRTWIGIGILLSITSIVASSISLSSTSRLVWKLDRDFDFKEQVSTAWSISQKRQADTFFRDLLLSDVLPMLAVARKRIFRRGWFLLPDFISTLIVLLASIGILYPATFHRENLVLPEQLQPEELVAVAKDPTYQDVLPKGIFSLDQNENQQGMDSRSTTDHGNGPSWDIPGWDDALKKTGKGLSQQAATAELGKALEDLDLNKSAEFLDSLAGIASSLPPQIQDQLAQSMQQASDTLQQALPNTPLSQDLKNAAKSLSGNTPAEQKIPAKDALAKVASDLRQIGQELAGSQANAKGGGGGGSGRGNGIAQLGQSEPMSRLQGEGGTFELPQNGSGLEGVLTNNAPDSSAPPTGAATSGAVSNTETTNNVPVQDVIIPFSYSWDWRNVVAQFFQRNP